MTPTGTKKTIIFLIFTLFILIGTMFLSTIDTPTGRVTSNNNEIKILNINEQFKENTSLDIHLQDITKISISGTYEGEMGDKAKIYAKTNNGSIRLIAEIILDESSNNTISQFTARVTGQTQNLDEEIQINESNENNATIENNSILDDSYVEDDVVVDNDTMIENDVNNDTMIENDVNNDTIVDEDEFVDESDIVDDVNENKTEKLFEEFNNLCHQTCSLIKIDVVQIIIEVEQGTLNLATINYVQETQQDEIKKKVENIQMNIGDNITINANEYFNGENLIFDTKTSEGYTYNIQENNLTFNAIKQGVWETTLYATNGTNLIVSNKFNITITDLNNELPKQENETQQDEQNESNKIELEPETEPTNDTTTIDENNTIEENTTIIEENTTSIDENVTLIEEENKTTDQTGCDHPNPNERPLECIQQENTTYFQPEDLILENTRGEKIAKFTPIGNLLITGDFIENSQEKAQPHDYQLGYVNNQGEFESTVWINSNTGDLHLKGKLNEANSNLIMKQGLSVITNKRGILLAIINRQTGDMHIRGNVVPYRRSLE